MVIESSCVTLKPIMVAHAEFLTILANNELLKMILGENPTSQDYWTQAIEEWCKDPDEQGFIIYRSLDEKPLGWAAINGITSNHQVAWIKMLVLLPAYWGHGYGTAAIQSLKKWCSEHNFAYLRLWTDENNVRACKCYERNNFVVIRRGKRMAGSQQALRERVCMQCELGR